MQDLNGAQKVAFNDKTLACENSTKYYAEAILKPFVRIPKGTPVIDGQADDVWNKAASVPLTIALGAEVSSEVKMLWDEKALYVYVTVEDAVLNKQNEEVHQQDSFEIFIDELNTKNDAYASGSRIGTLSWYDETGSGWSNPSVLGVAELVDELSAAASEEAAESSNAPQQETEEEDNSGVPTAAIVAVLLAGTSACLIAKRKKEGEEKEDSEEK